MDQMVEMVIGRLEHAGKTLLSMPDRGYSPVLAQGRHEYLYEFSDLIGWKRDLQTRPARPNAEDISRMDEAYGWIFFVPANDVPTRRVLHARSLVHPVNGSHLLSWRAIGQAMHKDHHWVQRKFVTGIQMIIFGLHKRPTNHYEKHHDAAIRA